MHQKVKLTIQGKQCHVIYQVNKIIIENVQLNFYTDFGLTNFAVSNLAIINLAQVANQGSVDSSDTVSQENIPCDQHTWKLISRNAQSSPGFVIKNAILQLESKSWEDRGVGKISKILSKTAKCYK